MLTAAVVVGKGIWPQFLQCVVVHVAVLTAAVAMQGPQGKGATAAGRLGWPQPDICKPTGWARLQAVPGLPSHVAPCSCVTNAADLSLHGQCCAAVNQAEVDT